MVDFPDKASWSDEFKASGHICYGAKEWPAVEVQADGGLWVDSRLATAFQGEGEPDEDVSPLLLLYSTDPGKDINIGGAPEAFVAGEMRYVADTTEFAESFPNGLPGSSRESIETYCRNDDKARSVISLPLPSAGRIVGVLNVYRNSPGIMGSEVKAESFARLLTPFVVLLGKIVTKIELNR